VNKATPPAAPASKIEATVKSEPAVSTASIRASANSLHHFDAPPASGAPKELEELLHGKPKQNLIFGIKMEFIVLLSIFVIAFIIVYFMTGPGFTH
jgi:hypothetical protein